MDYALLPELDGALAGGKPVRLQREIRNTDRATGALISSVKAVSLMPTGICNGKSRLVHRVSTDSCLNSCENGASLASTSVKYDSLPM